MLHEMKRKTQKTLNLFHILNMLKNFPRLKCLKGFFDPHRTARFVAALIVLGKREVSAGLQIYPKKILRCTNQAHKALQKDAQCA